MPSVGTSFLTMLSRSRVCMRCGAARRPQALEQPVAQETPWELSSVPARRPHPETQGRPAKNQGSDQRARLATYRPDSTRLQVTEGECMARLIQWWTSLGWLQALHQRVKTRQRDLNLHKNQG